MKKTYKLLVLSSFTLALTGCSLSAPEYSWCPPEQPMIEQVNLSADALFKFNKSAKEDLLPKGRETLDELANKLTTGYTQVDKIDLVGHTDRLGSEKSNYKLGLNRAETVRDYLQQRGIKAKIHVESAGESQPVTDNCVGNKATPELTACLQPDRRVTIKIEGIRKP